MGSKMPAAPVAPTGTPEIPKEETLTDEEKRSNENERRRQAMKEGQTQTILSRDILGGSSEDTKKDKKGVL